MKKMIMLVAAFAATMGAIAAEIAPPLWATADGRQWPYYLNPDGSVEICGVYDYSRGMFVCGINPAPEGVVNVPGTLDGRPVTAIGDSAFRGCVGMTQVNVPDGVETIGANAFMECTGLETANLGKDIKVIEAAAFLFAKNLVSIGIPFGVTTIGVTSFADSGVKNLVFPASVENIGKNALAGTSQLEELTLPKWCEKIPETLWRVQLGLGEKTRIVFKDVGGKVQDWKVSWKKARTLMGEVTRSGVLNMDPVGVIEVKCGKANGKGLASVSAKITDMDGKSTSYKAQKNVDVTGATTKVTFPKTAKNEELSIEINGEEFSGGEEALAGGMRVRSAIVGGNLPDGEAVFSVDFSSGEPLPEDVMTELLPTDVQFSIVNSKFRFPKATVVKVKKNGKTKEYVITIDKENGKTNLSAMKYSYNKKNGQAKGSLTLYRLNKTAKSWKLQKTSAKINGYVIGGAGYGRMNVKWGGKVQNFYKAGFWMRKLPVK